MKCRIPRNNEQGQALVEMAVVLPLFVMMLLFAIWLWEIVQIKLKVQEAARYAAWQATAYPLHDYSAGVQGLNTKFLLMQAQVSAESSLRFNDLDSSTLVPQGSRLMMASWDTPKVIIPLNFGTTQTGAIIGMISNMAGLTLTGNEQEELLPGGSLVNIVGRLVGTVAMATLAMRYRHARNVVANALIAVGGSNAYGISGGGGAAIQAFGSPLWGFNTAGYIRALATVKVHNDWFNVRIMGKPIFRDSGLVMTEQHGVLADSWRLNDGSQVLNSPPDSFADIKAEMGAVWHAAWNKGDKKLWPHLKDIWGRVAGKTELDAYGNPVPNQESLGGIFKRLKNWAGGQASKYSTVLNVVGLGGLASLFGSGGGGYYAQVSRMYLGHKLASKAFGSFMTLFVNFMRAPLAITATDVGVGAIPLTGVAIPLTGVSANVDWGAYLMRPGVLSRPYIYDHKKNQLQSGLMPIFEDWNVRQGGLASYNTAPYLQSEDNPQQQVLEERGQNFMGCGEPQKVGCTDTLAQDNPFGAYNYVPRGDDK